MKKRKKKKTKSLPTPLFYITQKKTYIEKMKFFWFCFLRYYNLPKKKKKQHNSTFKKSYWFNKKRREKRPICE